MSPASQRLRGPSCLLPASCHGGVDARLLTPGLRRPGQAKVSPFYRGVERLRAGGLGSHQLPPVLPCQPLSLQKAKTFQPLGEKVGRLMGWEL